MDGLTILERYKKENEINITESEKVIKEYLKKYKIKFEFQKIFHINGCSYIADFYIPRWKTIIEVDGEYHTGIQKFKDYERDNNLRNLPDVYSVRRILKENVLKTSYEEFSEWMRKIKPDDRKVDFMSKKKARALKKKLDKFYKFKFGKYKGYRTTEVPKEYLEWFKKNVPKTLW